MCGGAAEWVDFKFTLAASDYHYNYLVEVEDLTATEGNPNPVALSLHKFDYDVPADRLTESRSMRAIDGMHALACYNIEGPFHFWAGRPDRHGSRRQEASSGEAGGVAAFFGRSPPHPGVVVAPRRHPGLAALN